jgi:hypothetical protein
MPQTATNWNYSLFDRTAVSWYPKPLPTFSEALAEVRRELWAPRSSETSRQQRDIAAAKFPGGALNRLINVACYAA